MNEREAEILIDAIRRLAPNPHAPDVGKASLDVVGTIGGKATIETARKAGTSPLRGKPLELSGGTVFEPRPAPAGGLHDLGLSPDAIEQLYTTIKNRIIDEARLDPILLQLLTVRPELVVEVEPRLVSVGGMSLKGRIARLMANGWLKTARKQNEIRVELTRTGTEPNSGQLSTTVNDYVADGFLTRDGDGYVLAPSVKVTERELRAV